MRHSGIGILVFLTACHGAVAPAAPGPVTPTGDFAALLVRAQAEDPTLDFHALRLEYATTPLYQPYGDRDSEREDSMVAAIQRDSFAVALIWADSLLGDNPVTPNGHAAAGYAAHALHDSVGGAHHWWMARHLLESILHSDAGTESSPMVVIAVYEEYALAEYLGLRRGGAQALGECGGHACDAVTFRDSRTGRDTTLHFDVSIPMAQLERSFQH